MPGRDFGGVGDQRPIESRATDKPWRPGGGVPEYLVLAFPSLVRQTTVMPCKRTGGPAARRHRSSRNPTLDNRFDARRPAEQVSLAQRHAQGAERGQFRVGLDPLGEQDAAGFPGE